MGNLAIVYIYSLLRSKIAIKILKNFLPSVFVTPVSFSSDVVEKTTAELKLARNALKRTKMLRNDVILLVFLTP